MSHRTQPPWNQQGALAQRAALYQLLADISREALHGDSLDAVLRRIVDTVVQRLPVQVASIILLDETGDHFEKEVSAGELDLDVPGGLLPWPVTIGAAGRCARTREPQWIPDVTADPDYVPGHSAVLSEYLVPIVHKQRLHGVLNLESTDPAFFTDEVRVVFAALAEQIGGAVHLFRVLNELAAANQKLERLALLDGLTGVANRRGLEQHLTRLWECPPAGGTELALALVDADHFKRLNDAVGHLQGDEWLRELAGLCRHASNGDEDLAARYGGEEFALVWPGRSRIEARRMAEQLRSQVETRALHHPDSPIGPVLTVSIGLAVIRLPSDQPPEALIAAADRALYAAKRGGRNRIVLYAPGS